LKVKTLSGYAYSILKKYGNECYEEVLGILSVFEYGFLFFMTNKQVTDCVFATFHKDLMYLYRQAINMDNFIVVDRNNYDNPNFKPVYQCIAISIMVLTGEYLRARSTSKALDEYIQKSLRVEKQYGYQLALDYKNGILQNVTKEHQAQILSNIHRKIYKQFAKDNVDEFPQKRFNKLRTIDRQVTDKVNAERYIDNKDTYHLLANIQYLIDTNHFDRCLDNGIISGFEYKRLVNLQNKHIISYVDMLVLDKTLGGRKLYDLLYSQLNGSNR
jgi:hypothetical protein